MIRRLAASGVRQKEIAEKTGLPKQTVSDIVRESGHRTAPAFTTPDLTVTVHGEVNNSPEPGLTIPWLVLIPGGLSLHPGPLPQRRGGVCWTPPPRAARTGLPPHRWHRYPPGGHRIDDPRRCALTGSTAIPSRHQLGDPGASWGPLWARGAACSHWPVRRRRRGATGDWSIRT